MRELTLGERIFDTQIVRLETMVDSPFSEDFKHIIKKYAGLSVKERYFVDSNLTVWELHEFVDYPAMFRMIQEFINVGWGKKLPFACDPGGWHFCLSFDADTFGAVIVNRWTDFEAHEQFLKIADSFEAFIGGLNETQPHAGG